MGKKILTILCSKLCYLNLCINYNDSLLLFSAYQPYQMDKPMNLRAQAMSDSSIYITWYDPALERDQLIRDSRFYTVRYYSFEYGRYEYKNITEHRGTIDGLQSDMEYNFEVRSMNPPYLSEWSEPAKNKTMARSGKDLSSLNFEFITSGFWNF